ncbi:MAG: hypothetical protein IKL53_08660 [Lachnospiraceae bacterium]|nr:hypothetical protein [Lachnospiraceae bacterium]
MQSFNDTVVTRYIVEEKEDSCQIIEGDASSLLKQGYKPRDMYSSKQEAVARYEQHMRYVLKGQEMRSESFREKMINKCLKIEERKRKNVKGYSRLYIVPNLEALVRLDENWLKAYSRILDYLGEEEGIFPECGWRHYEGYSFNCGFPLMSRYIIKAEAKKEIIRKLKERFGADMFIEIRFVDKKGDYDDEGYHYFM